MAAVSGSGEYEALTNGPRETTRASETPLKRDWCHAVLSNPNTYGAS